MARIKIDMFRMYMGSLASYFQTSVSEDVVEKDYWPHYKYLDTEIIIKMIDWLKENYSFDGYNIKFKFPLKPIFDRARMEVMRQKPTEYKPDPQNRNPNYCENMKRILWGFKQMDKIRHIEIPGCDTMSQSTVSDTIQAFWRKVRSNGTVFSLKTEKWVDRKNVIHGEYFDPCEFGLGLV